MRVQNALHFDGHLDNFFCPSYRELSFFLRERKERKKKEKKETSVTNKDAMRAARKRLLYFLAQKTSLHKLKYLKSKDF